MQKITRETEVMQDEVMKQGEEITERIRKEREQKIFDLSDTSNWKTYRNEEYGFEVKYPESMFYPKEITDSNGGLYVQLTQKGYLINDRNHSVSISIYELKSIKAYHMERYGKCTPVKVANTKGKICGYEKEKFATYGPNFQKHLNAYTSFVKEGICSESFYVFFAERRVRDAGDFFNSLAIDCNNENGMEKVYKQIYDSIVFFENSLTGTFKER